MIYTSEDADFFAIVDSVIEDSISDDPIIISLNPHAKSFVAIHEEFLDSVQVDECTYEYRDSSGELLAIYEVYQDYSIVRGASRASTRHLSWMALPNSILKDSVLLGTQVSLYLNISNGSGSSTYVGFYQAAADIYAWFNPPFAGTVFGSAIIYAISNISFAMKNAGSVRTSYNGYYTVF